MPLLEVDDVVVQFGGVVAVDHASFAADAGRVTGLIGPNGAGKTTCFNVISGLQKPTRGRVRFDGRDITRTPVHRRARRGMARTFQRLEAFGSLTVRENVRVALDIHRGLARAGPPGRRQHRPAARAGRDRGVRRRARRLDPHRHRPAARAGPLPGRRPEAAAARRAVVGARRARDRRVRRAARPAGHRGARDPHGRARHGPRDGGVRHHPRARLRRGHRLGQPVEIRADARVQQAYLGYSDDRARRHAGAPGRRREVSR